MRRRLLLVAALVSGTAALGFSYLATRGVPQRGLIAVESEHDFGVLSQGDEVAFEFLLTNRFEEPVTIRNVIKSCGCTDVELSREALQTGEQLKLKAQWRVGASRGHSGVVLTVIAALPNNRLAITELRMVGTVTPDIRYEPEILEFSSSVTSRRVVFSPGLMNDFTLKRAYCTHKAFEARLLSDGKSVEVIYHPDTTLEKNAKEFLVVDTTSLHEPACRLQLTVATQEPPGS
jgi:hypothetical protein